MAKTYTYRGVTFRTWRCAEVNLTERRIKNLLDMAFVIQNSPPPKFGMSSYNEFDNYDAVRDVLSTNNFRQTCGNLTPYSLNKFAKLDEEEINICGTSCCAIGTAAYNGVGNCFTKDMDWDDYSVKAFGIEERTNVWSFLFDGYWANYDNTPEGAVARILCLIDKGPTGVDQMMRDSSYSSIKAKYEVYKDIELLTP